MRPGTATSTFTQLLSSSASSSSVLLYVHRTMRAIRDGETRNGHPDFHTVPSELFCKFRFSVALQFSSVLLYVHKNRRLIRDGHLDFHTAAELCCFTSTETRGTSIRGVPRRPSRISCRSWALTTYAVV